MAEAAAVADADDADTTVGRPLPMGLTEAGLLLLLFGAITESRWEDGDEDDGTGWSNGDGVMLARAGGCPIGVIDRLEPVPTGAILLLLLLVVVVVLTEAVGAATAGIKLEVVLVGAWIGAGSGCDGAAAAAAVVGAALVWLVDAADTVEEDETEVVLVMLVSTLLLLLVLLLAATAVDELPNGAGSPLAGDCRIWTGGRMVAGALAATELEMLLGGALLDAGV